MRNSSKRTHCKKDGRRCSSQVGDGILDGGRDDGSCSYGGSALGGPDHRRRCCSPVPGDAKLRVAVCRHCSAGRDRHRCSLSSAALLLLLRVLLQKLPPPHHLLFFYCFSCDFTIAVDAVRIIRIGILVVETCLRIRRYAAMPRLPEVFRWQAKRSSRPQGDPFFSNREPRPLKEHRVARYFDAYVIVGSIYLFIVPRGSFAKSTNMHKEAPKPL